MHDGKAETSHLIYIIYNHENFVRILQICDMEMTIQQVYGALSGSTNCNLIIGGSL